ncbi:Nonribosomal Peptide Synthase (NRPS) [Pseudogymnoascus sp. 24MN13]|nr:Nonribosomal Peptide Synthase (NRPS) [Pseudogymnoascus sp. 24MN13]
MVSSFEIDPTWQSWNSCLVCSSSSSSSEEHKRKLLVERSLNVNKVVVLNDAFDHKLVRTFCGSNNVPPDSLFKAAWSIVVGAYVGTADVCFMVESAAPTRNVLRCRLDPAETASRLLHSFQEVPFTTRIDVDAAAGLSNAVFDTCLRILGKESLEPPQTNRVGDTALSNGIFLSVDVDLDGETITINYPSDTYTQLQATRTARFLSHCVAEFIAHSSSLPLSSIDILPCSDADEIYTWNTKHLQNYDVCIHQAVSEQAARTPDNPAICAWDGKHTYRELDLLASQLAWKLHSLGLESGSTVAFLFPKSKWTVVAVLAIFKAGCAAVALNSEYPLERMRHITEMSSTKWLLVGKELEQMLELPGVEKVTVDDALLLPQQQNPADEGGALFTSPDVKPSDMAYIQFTSGSSGKPKGIVIEHGGFMANAMGHLKAIRLNSESRTLQFASHTFDAFLTEVMMSLLAGACVCIPSEDRRMNDLAGAIRELSVNWMGITPTLAKVLSPGDVSGLRTLCLWGEMAPRELIATWANSVDLINCYGPSENSVGATTHSFSSGSRNPSCIGTAVPTLNTWVVQMGNRNRLAPIGAVGELVLQGPTVAREYLGDAEKTRDAFGTGMPWLTDKESFQNQRIYLTGDLVRYESDGSLEFLGRNDTAVKIRGQRVELGEIEHHITHSGEMYEASVAMVIGPPHLSVEKLVAFVCETNDRAEEANKTGSLLKPSSMRARDNAVRLENYLSQVLTQAAVPSLYLPLQCIPTVPSGKVDRQRLLAVVASLTDDQLADYSTQATTIKEPPRSDTEVAVSKLWAEVLGIDVQKISRNDNFFYLGGNSILAMRLTLAARKSGLLMTVAQVLSNPLLVEIASLTTTSSTTEDVEMSTHGYSPFSTLSKVLVASFLKDVAAVKLSVSADDIEDIGLATDYQVENLAWSSLKKRGGTNYITLDFSGSLDPQRLQSACERLVAHHAILRTTYLIHQRCVFQVAFKRILLHITHIVNAENVAKTTSALVDEDLRHPLDIGEPLVKFWFITVGGGVSRLVLRASHLQYDGVALIRWCKELNFAYDNMQKLGPTPSFPEYTYFAANHDPQGARKFWRNLLVGSSMTKVLDHTEVPWRNVLDGQVDTMINSSLLQCDAGITAGTVIKSAWALVLAEMARADDVVFGSVVWGRNAPFPDVEHVAGACIDNIPVRVRLTRGMSRLALLQQVQGQYFEAVTYESFQYKRIVEECTDWKPWERLSTLVEYENLGEDTSQFPIDGNKHFTVDEIRPPADRHDITIYSMPVGEQTFVALDFCKSAIDEPVAQAMLDRMLAHIKSFKDDINGTTEMAEHSSSMPLIPLPLNDMSSSTNDGGLDEYEINGTSKKAAAGPIIGITESNTIKRLVEDAWMSVMSSQKEHLIEYWTNKKPFFDVWGNLIAATGIAKFYGAEGFSVSMEDILENPNMEAQAKLLLRVSCPKTQL